MTTQPLPCPWCGGEAELYGSGRSWFWYVCGSCKSERGEHGYTTREDALAAWNERVPQPHTGWRPLQTKIAYGFGHESIIIDANSIGGLPLPDGVQIMERDAQPPVPVPDWSKVPNDRIKWWAVDPDGRQVWGEGKAACPRGYWRGIDEKGLSFSIYTVRGDKVDLPLGVDWRTTLTQRPAAQEE